MPLKIDFNINTIISLQWRTQKISGGDKVSSQSRDVTNQL